MITFPLSHILNSIIWEKSKINSFWVKVLNRLRWLGINGNEITNENAFNRDCLGIMYFK